MIDYSSSLTSDQFILEKKFVLEVIKNINPRQDGAHVAILFFALDHVLSHNFSSPQDLSKIESVLEAFTCNTTGDIDNCSNRGTAGTDTDFALELVNDYIFNETNGMRPDNVPKNVVLVTDGPCECIMGNESLLKTMEIFEQRNIRVVVVGVGQEDLTEEYLQDIFKVKSLDDVFFVNDFEEINEEFIERVSYCSGMNSLKIDTISYKISYKITTT